MERDTSFDVRSQTAIRLEERPLISEDPDSQAALRVLQEKGYTSDEVKQAYDYLDRGINDAS